MQEQRARKLKLLMACPLLVLPFVVLLFYAMGGGKGQKTTVKKERGLNTSLPAAQLDNNAFDKLSIYEQAEKDSIERVKQLASDPFYVKDEPFSHELPPKNFNPFDVNSEARTLSLNKKYGDHNEEKVKRKLAQLQQRLDESSSLDGYDRKRAFDSIIRIGEQRDYPPMRKISPPVLEDTASEPDQELAQLNAMLEKVLDIQHPERVSERMQPAKPKGQQPVMRVAPVTQEDVVEFIPANVASVDTMLNYHWNVLPAVNKFYELDDSTVPQQAHNVILATVHDQQIIVSGATVKFRLEQDILIQNQRIPKGIELYGLCALSGDRVKVTIDNIHYQHAVFDVSLTVYDGVDALEGIYIPDAISRDVSKQQTDRAIQTLQFGSLNPSLSAQAASTSMEAIKNLLSKKTRLVRVTLKAGHPVLLKPNK